MISILVLKTENKVMYNKSNLNCKTFFEEFIFTLLKHLMMLLYNFFRAFVRYNHTNTNENYK